MKNLLKIIRFFQENGIVMTTTEVARGTNISIKNISRYLDKLQKMGFIDRETEQDGKKRFVLNYLTEKGKIISIPETFVETL